MKENKMNRVNQDADKNKSYQDNQNTKDNPKMQWGRVMEAYSPIVCEFLSDLSRWIRQSKEAAKYPDVLSVGFWCRKANVEKMKVEFADGRLHMGRGLLFHITPSNVPVNFAFSYFFGLLSGNGNIVRIPTKKFPQVDILIQGIEEVLKDEKYAEVRQMTEFVSYERNQETTDYYSGLCDGRIIWGGDASIQSIRQSPLKPKAVEVVFADRYSFGVIQSEKILQASEQELQVLARGFYNDTYLMDQNACSTPHCIFWLGEQVEEAAAIFWEYVRKEAQHYALEDIKAVDKYTKLCQISMEREDIKAIKTYDNYLYVVELENVPQDLEQVRGQFGLFYQCSIQSLDELCENITQKSQTMLTYGVESEEVRRFISEGRMQGIDRVVPFGKGLDIGVIWDGYDIIRSLSRSITII